MHQTSKSSQVNREDTLMRSAHLESKCLVDTERALMPEMSRNNQEVQLCNLKHLEDCNIQCRKLSAMKKNQHKKTLQGKECMLRSRL